MFERIVVGTDGSDTAGEAVRQATELARATGAKLDIISVYRPVSATRLREEAGDIPGDVAHAVGPKEDVNVVLEGAAGLTKESGVEVSTHAREGDPADAILDLAEELGASLIVVGNKGMTGARRFSARQRAEQDLPPRPVQRLHRADHLGVARIAGGDRALGVEEAGRVEALGLRGPGRALKP